MNMTASMTEKEHQIVTCKLVEKLAESWLAGGHDYVVATILGVGVEAPTLAIRVHRRLDRVWASMAGANGGSEGDGLLAALEEAIAKK
jgi:hypothetical protein